MWEKISACLNTVCFGPYNFLTLLYTAWRRSHFTFVHIIYMYCLDKISNRSCEISKVNSPGYKEPSWPYTDGECGSLSTNLFATLTALAHLNPHLCCTLATLTMWCMERLVTLSMGHPFCPANYRVVHGEVDDTAHQNDRASFQNVLHLKHPK